MKADIETIIGLLDKAAPEPWAYTADCPVEIFDGNGSRVAKMGHGYDMGDLNNADAVCELINAAPSLLAELALARAVIEAARSIPTRDAEIERLFDRIRAYDAHVAKKGGE